MTLYRGMDRAALDAAYNNRAAVPGYLAITEERRERGARIRRTRRFQADLRYGERPRERLDFFPADRPGAPVLVYVHGGYWQWNDKEDSSFLVAGPLARGFAVALVEYTLAPAVRVDGIVDEIDRVLAWLGAHAAELGGDPGRLLLSGHSAGGHLTAMMLGRRPLAGALPISGLYDLEPIRLCYLNEVLGLDEASARRNSPLAHLPAESPRVVVAVGSGELPELVRHSAEYAAALRERGLPASYLPLAGHDHFSLLEELADPNGKLCEALVDLAGRR